MALELGLAGRTALITGGSKGIGRAIARGLARQGVNVVLLARGQELLEKTADEIRKESGVKVLATAADITKADQVDASAATVKETFGTVHIVVNNAGGPMRRMDRQILWPDSDWIADLDNKILGALRVTRAFLPLMPGDGTGRIINISGTASTIVWAPALTHGLNNAAMNQATGYLADGSGQPADHRQYGRPRSGRHRGPRGLGREHGQAAERHQRGVRLQLLQADGHSRRPLGDDGRSGGHGGVPRLRSCALFQRVEDHSRRRFERERTARVVADIAFGARDRAAHEFRTTSTFL